ncbi:Crp/Fnr family transcriptional regulator [Candidatus Bipolaricaulota bacterium]|nr:Crp/Fnr family transcriptional regulator [Candidatus Bipolaricaulota bacterium]
MSAVARAIRCFSIPDGAYLFHQGAPIAGSYILCRGRAKLFTQASDGRSVLLRFCRAGELLVIPVHDAHTVSAQAVGDAVAGVIDGAKLFERHLGLALAVIRRQAQELLRYRRRIANLATKSVRGRLIALLHELATEYGVLHDDSRVLIDLDLSIQDLADMAGCTRQTASRELPGCGRRGCSPAPAAGSPSLIPRGWLSSSGDVVTEADRSSPSWARASEGGRAWPLVGVDGLSWPR